MLHLYDLNHNKIKGLKKYKDYHTKSVLSTSDKTLYFSYPLHLSKEIFEECYIRDKENEFIIKQISDGEEGWLNFVATLNVEDLEGKEWKSFETVESTIEDSLNLAFAGTGWIVKSSTVTKKRTIRLTNTDSYKILQQAIKTYRCEIKLDSIKKEVVIKERLGGDKGVYFTDSLNIVSLNSNSNTNEFYTRMVALGKTTTTGEGDEAVENTLEVVVENHQYSNKVKTLIWKDERYTDESSLLEDATYKLDEISKPYRSYSVQIYDLANMNSIYKDILSYDIGDTITLISNNRNFKDKQRIVSIDKYPEEPERNSCELGNVTATFDQIQKEQEEVKNTVNNITSDNGTISEGAIRDVVKLIVGTLNVEEINAIKINVGKLEATVAEINTAYIDKAYIDKLIVNYATIENLEAALAKIGILEVDYGVIKELLAGHITSGNIQVGSISGDSLNMKTIFVKDANILDLTAGKITGGTIDTSKVTISSKNGNIILADATQQFKDNAGNLRLQLGQDAKGDFNFILYDATGNGILIDSTGIKESAIADGMIKEDMIGEGQIGGKNINWTSFVNEFNKDTNTNSILSSKILVDGTNQTVNFHLNKLSEQISTIEGLDGDVSGMIETVSSHTTQLNLQRGQIDTLIQDTTITKNGQTTKLKDEYNKTVATVNSQTSTIASHTSEINDLDGTVKSVDSKVNEVKRDLEGTKSTVSSTSTKVTELENTVSNQESSITQLNKEIALKVTQEQVNTTIQPISQELQQLKSDTKSDINDVNERVNGIIADVGGAIADGIISEAETITISNSIDALNREKKDIDSRYTAIYANSNLKGATKTALNTKYTAYNTSHTNLINNINEMISDKVATVSEKVTYKTKLNEYSTALSQLSEAFDNAIYNISLNEAIAKDEALKTTLQGNINDVSKVANAAKDALGNYTADGILDEAEKESVRTHLKNLATEKADVDKEYTSLYSNSDLIGTSKSNLKTDYDNYVVKYNDLVSKINTLLNATTITETMRTNINNAFSTHDSYLATYSQRVNEAFIAISEKKKQDAITTSNAYYNAQIVIDKKSIISTVSETYSTKTETSSAIDTAKKYADGLNSALGSDLQNQIDGKIETFSQSADPSTNWTTSALKTQHTGDIWYNTTTKITYRWSGTAWLKLEDADATNATTLAQSKKRVFTATPTTPYEVGDLWITNLSSSGDIKICKTARSTGSYTASDWILASKYTDDTYAKSVEGKVTQTAKDLTATFTEMHNGGYEQGITTINKDGVQVEHSDTGTRSKMSAQGFSIIDNATGDVLAWLSSKEQWTEIKADKVFAGNLENIYTGSPNLYVDHSYTGAIDGSASKPFSSFADLQSYLSITPVINMDLFITVRDPGFVITEQLCLHNLKGSGYIKITLEGKLVIRSPGAGQYCIRLYQILKWVWIIGSRTSPTSNIDGPVLCDNPDYNGGGHGICASDVTRLEVDALTIACKNWGILTERTDLYTWWVDFGKCYTSVELRYQSIYYSSGDCGSGANFCIMRSGSKAFWGNASSPQRPMGNCDAANGIFFSFGECSVKTSARYQTSNPVPPTGTSNYTSNFGWTSHKTYQYQWNNWGDSDCKQGSWGYGLRGGHMFFDIASIRSFLSGTVLDGNTITLTRASSGGLSSGANVYINGSTCNGASGTPGYSNQTFLGTLAWGETKTFTLPKSIVQSLKSGACNSLAVYVNSTAQGNYLNIVNCSITLKVSK